jgi:hypothetical protein
MASYNAEVVSIQMIQIRVLTDAWLLRFHCGMPYTPSENHLSKLLLESEAAARLRRSCSHVKRLRLERKLAYLRGTPVTIDEKDLEIFVAWAKRRRVARSKMLRTGKKKRAKGESEAFEYVSANALPKPFTLLTVAEAAIKFERTPRQIRYLCLRGRIPHIVGRPPLIDEADLVEHFEKKRTAALAKIPPTPGTPEFKAAEKRKAAERVSRKLRAKRIRREVARFLAERGTA